MKKPTLETGLAAFAVLIIAALVAFVIFIIVSIYEDYKNTPRMEIKPILVEIDCGTMNHRIFYDKETGVMYIENTAKGGIFPMYNADGTLKIYKE